MFRYFLLFLNFVAFHRFCHTESVRVIFNLHLTAQVFGGNYFKMRENDAIRAFSDKTLEIIVGQHPISDIKCNDPSQKPIQFNISTDDIFKIKVPKVTNEMSTKWKCTIKEDGKPDFILTLNVHVIAAEYPSLTIGSDPLVLTMTNNISTQYDAIAHYSFMDGQKIQLKCQSPENILSIIFHDVKDTKNTQPNLNIATFEKQLSKEDNGAEVDCILSTKYNKYIYRVKLQLNETEIFAGLSEENTLITISLVVFVILGLLITCALFFWRQRSNKELQSDSDIVDLVSDSVATTRRNTKTTDFLHELHNNDLYAVSMKKLAKRENMYEDPVYSVPEQFYQNT